MARAVRPVCHKVGVPAGRRARGRSSRGVPSGGHDAIEACVAGAERLGDALAKNTSLTAERGNLLSRRKALRSQPAPKARSAWRWIEPTMVLAACSRVELLRI